MALETAAASDRLDPSMRFRMAQPLRNSNDLASSATEAADDEGHKTKRFDDCRLAGVVLTDDDRQLSERDDVIIEPAKVA
jgi:hypothetical protein